MTIETASAPHSHGFTSKRVGGVPVIYIAGGVVAVLAVYAWRAKSAPAAPAETDTTTDTTGAPTDGTLYPSPPDGTVSTPVTGQETTPTTGNTAITDNGAWLQAAETYLIGKGYGAGTAQLALQTYLDGSDMTYDQGVMRDAAIAQFGLPPDGATIGATGAKPPTPAVYTGYKENPVTGEIFGVKADGSEVYLSNAEWKSLGSPKPTETVPTATLYRGYVEDPRTHAIYGETHSGSYVWLTNAQWKALGAPKARLMSASEKAHIK